MWKHAAETVVSILAGTGHAILPVQTLPHGSEGWGCAVTHWSS